MRALRSKLSFATLPCVLVGEREGAGRGMGRPSKERGKGQWVTGQPQECRTSLPGCLEVGEPRAFRSCVTGVGVAPPQVVTPMSQASWWSGRPLEVFTPMTQDAWWSGSPLQVCTLVTQAPVPPSQGWVVRPWGYSAAPCGPGWMVQWGAPGGIHTVTQAGYSRWLPVPFFPRAGSGWKLERVVKLEHLLCQLLPGPAAAHSGVQRAFIRGRRMPGPLGGDSRLLSPAVPRSAACPGACGGGGTWWACGGVSGTVEVVAGAVGGALVFFRSKLSSASAPWVSISFLLMASCCYILGPCVCVPTCVPPCWLCPAVDGKWQSWASWGGCSVTCGGGTQRRERVCSGPFFGGAACQGPQDEYRQCSAQRCPGECRPSHPPAGLWGGAP